MSVPCLDLVLVSSMHSLYVSVSCCFSNTTFQILVVLASEYF